ncbi:MAG: hypothetical protein NTY38_33020, partial [Acidobacteria bacterium]|nr:hypothetical protein [Acidobacteriota bacterium]
EFEELLLEYDNEFQPDSEHEHFLVALLAESRWKLARYERLQSLALDQILAAGGPEQSPDARILAALSQPTCVLDRLQRYAAQAERTYLRAHRELVQIQRQRVKDHGTALDAQLARVLDAPMPDHPQYGAYRDILQNEANPTPNPPTPPEYVLK